MTSEDALRLRPGDRLIVAERIPYVVIQRPRRLGNRPLMIAARRADHPLATAQYLQVGAIRMRREDSTDVR